MITGMRTPLRIREPGRARRSSAFTVKVYGRLETFFSPSYSERTTCTRKGVSGAGASDFGFEASCATVPDAAIATNASTAKRCFFMHRSLNELVQKQSLSGSRRRAAQLTTAL